MTQSYQSYLNNVSKQFVKQRMPFSITDELAKQEQSFTSSIELYRIQKNYFYRHAKL